MVATSMKRVLLIGAVLAAVSALVGFYAVVAFNHEKIWPEYVDPW